MFSVQLCNSFQLKRRPSFFTYGNASPGRLSPARLCDYSQAATGMRTHAFALSPFRWLIPCCAHRAFTPSLAVASAVHHVTQMSADPLYTWAAARWVLCVLGQRGSLTVVSERLFVFCVAAPGVDPMLCAVSSTIEF